MEKTGGEELYKEQLEGRKKPGLFPPNQEDFLLREWRILVRGKENLGLGSRDSRRGACFYSRYTGDGERGPDLEMKDVKETKSSEIRNKKEEKHYSPTRRRKIEENLCDQEGDVFRKVLLIGGQRSSPKDAGSEGREPTYELARAHGRMVGGAQAEGESAQEERSIENVARGKTGKEGGQEDKGPARD